jgi:hypothetical protein
MQYLEYTIPKQIHKLNQVHSYLIPCSVKQHTSMSPSKSQGKQFNNSSKNLLTKTLWSKTPYSHSKTKAHSSCDHPSTTGKLSMKESITRIAVTYHLTTPYVKLSSAHTMIQNPPDTLKFMPPPSLFVETTGGPDSHNR